MYLTIQGVYDLGRTPNVALRSEQPLSVPAGETDEIHVEVFDESGAVFDLSGCQLLLTVKTYPTDVNPIVSRQATIDFPNLGKAFFPTTAGDTLTFGGARYYDVWLTDALGNRQQIVPTSLFFVLPALGQPGQIVTVPPTQTPLGLGPPGVPIAAYPSLSNFPDPLTNVGRVAFALDSNSLYVSENSAWRIVGGATIPVGTDGQFLGHISGIPQYVTLTQDMIAPAFSVGLTGPSSPVEVGASVVNPQLTCSHNQVPSAASLTDFQGTQAISPATLTALGYGGAANTFSAKTYAYPGSVNSTRSWTYSATSATITRTASASVQWQARAYYGQAVPGTFDSAFANALASNRLQPGFANNYAIAAGNGSTKQYIVLPTAWGTPTLFKDSTTLDPIAFVRVASGVNVTNPQGASVPCDFWEGPQFVTAAFTFAVS